MENDKWKMENDKSNRTSLALDICHFPFVIFHLPFVI